MVDNQWNHFLSEEFKQSYFKELNHFIEIEYTNKTIFPKREDIFKAFELTDLSEVKVVIIGQDPYHQENQAHGLCFSVQKGVKIPPSLNNIFKELVNDVGCSFPNHGCLESWAKQGVFLLNTILTVEKSKPLSHKNKGWEIFSDRVIQLLNKQTNPIVFVLWGNQAKVKKELLTNKNHMILESAHPSPLSAYHGFFNTKPFTKINEFLKSQNLKEINWEIED